MKFPDWSQSKALSSGIKYTAEEDGYVHWSLITSHGNYGRSLYINDIPVTWVDTDNSGTYYSDDSILVPVKKGDSFYANGDFRKYNFYPLR